MIYPEQIPQSRKGHPEETVFNQLKKVSDKYDIFYSRKFIGKDSYERVEYEIDFLIAEPKRAIICLEVKGGLIHFDGMTNRWSQNHKPMNKGSDEQVTSALLL
ncbi:MAG: NERD domain-containing protein [Leptospiraceae bacterium]|nr:NERD domain-containing protein [Leptospiraceae bacterium]